MICRLCFQDNSNCFYLFDCEGLSLEAAKIIGKHFWFEPKEKDTESLYICRPCWSIVDGFHNLYILVENAQNKLEKIKFDEHSIAGNQFKSIIDLKSENVSLKSEDSIDDEFLSNSEFLQNTLNDFCEDSIAYDASETKKSKVQKIKVKTINEINIAISEEVRGTRSRSKLEEKLRNNNITLETEKLKNKIAPIKKKKRGRPSAAEVEERKSKQTDLEPLKPKKPPNEVVSDDEINKMRRITCQICLIEIPTFLELKKHFLQVHDEPGYAICCDKKFFKRYKFVNHLKMHVNPNEYKCPHCDKILVNKKYISDHIKNMHAKIEKVRNFTCETCSKSFAQKGSLARHLLTHVPENEKLFQCELCEKSFPTQGLLRTHKITVHEGRYGGICALCGKKYQNPQDLKRHCLEHEGISQPKAQCEVCGDWLTNKYKLKRHMLKHNTAHLEHKCPHCSKTSPNELALKSHIKFAHNDNNKIHQCNVCEKAFRRRIDLKEHMTVHTGEHLYTCPHCPRTFTHHSNLHHHRKKMHRKEFDELRAKKGTSKIPWIRTVELKRESDSLITSIG